jgi:hypothetical protein
MELNYQKKLKLEKDMELQREKELKEKELKEKELKEKELKLKKDMELNYQKKLKLEKDMELQREKELQEKELNSIDNQQVENLNNFNNSLKNKTIEDLVNMLKNKIDLKNISNYNLKQDIALKELKETSNKELIFSNYIYDRASFIKRYYITQKLILDYQQKYITQNTNINEYRNSLFNIENRINDYNKIINFIKEYILQQYKNNLK